MLIKILPVDPLEMTICLFQSWVLNNNTEEQDIDRDKKIENSVRGVYK